ncbi:response regulator [Candidatus Fermentibacterales bacterium]|nr:response regulator [Candidatus Fermentibacterales bacterium]
MVSPPTRVLLIESLPVTPLPHGGDDPRAGSGLLFDGNSAFQVVRVPSVDAAREALSRSGFDVLVADLDALDDGSPGSLLPILSSRTSPPVLAVGDEHHSGRALDYLQFGVQDFLLKGSFSPVVLERAIRYSIERERLRKQLEQQSLDLSSSEGRLRAIIDNTTDAIVVVGADGYIRFANAPASEIFGVPLEVLLSGRFEYDLAPGAITELERPGPDGSPRTLEMRAAEVVWESERGMLATLRDVTDRKQSEQEHRRLMDRIQQMQKIEAIGILAGGIAHDFNNILTSILGSLSLATSIAPPKPEDLRNLLREAEKAALRARNLTAQLLTFSRGGEPVKKVRFLRNVIKDACLFSMMGSGCKCELELPVDLWPAEVDENQFTQVVDNLVINAVQAMADAGTLEVTAGNIEIGEGDSLQLEPGPYIRLEVRDEGPGIPEEYLGRIFDPYFTTKQNGSGLGLAISYSIIGQHGGLIEVDSRLGEGSRFSVYLPAIPEGLPRTEESADPPRRGVGWVLVMDDDEGVLSIASQMLEHLGYRVATASDGDEAVSIYARERRSPDGNPFSAVIMDLTVPGAKNGVEALGELRQIDPEVTAIVSSGYFNDPVMANYREYGFSGVLTKPYRLAEIGEVLSEVLGSPGGPPGEPE